MSGYSLTLQAAQTLGQTLDNMGRAPRRAAHGSRPAAPGTRPTDRAAWGPGGGQLGDGGRAWDHGPGTSCTTSGGPWPPGGGRTIAAHGPRPAGHRATSWAHGPRPADLVPGAARSGAPGAAHAPSLAGGHGGRITPKKVTNRRPAVIPGEKKPATRAGGQAGGRLMRACLQRRPAGPASARPCPWRRPGRR